MVTSWRHKTGTTPSLFFKRDLKGALVVEDQPKKRRRRKTKVEETFEKLTLTAGELDRNIITTSVDNEQVAFNFRHMRIYPFYYTFVTSQTEMRDLCNAVVEQETDKNKKLHWERRAKLFNDGSGICFTSPTTFLNNYVCLVIGVKIYNHSTLHDFPRIISTLSHEIRHGVDMIDKRLDLSGHDKVSEATAYLTGFLHAEFLKFISVKYGIDIWASKPGQ